MRVNVRACERLVGRRVKFHWSRPALPAFCHIMELMALRRSQREMLLVATAQKMDETGCTHARRLSALQAAGQHTLHE